MNQNSRFCRAIWILSFFSFLVPYLLLVGADYYLCQPDVYCVYLPTFSGETPITDWHSSLFMYEGRTLTNVLSSLGISKPDFRAIRIMCLLSQITIFISLYALIRRLISHSFIYLCLFPLMGVTFLLFRHLTYCRFLFSIDLVFTAALLLSVTLPLFFNRNGQYRQKDIVIWILLIFSVIHLIHCRKNAILCMPFLFIYIASMVLPAPFGRRFVKIFFLACICLPFLYLINFVLPARHTYPAIPMIVSDVKIASILRDENEKVRSLLLEKTGLTYEDGINNFNTIGPLYFSRGCKMGYSKEATDAQWRELKDYYVETIREQPASIFFARAVQVVQFYTNGYVPFWIRHIVHRCFPGCSPYSPQWDWKPDVPYNRLGTTPERLIVYILTALAVYLSWRRIRCKGLSLPLSLSLITGTMALMYIFSFLPVTPTPNFRYHSPSMLLGCFSILCTAIYYFESRLGKQQK